MTRIIESVLRILPLLLLLPAVAAAQVSVNSGALDQLTPAAPAEHRPAPHRAAPRRAVRRARPVHPATPAHSQAPASAHTAPARPPVAPPVQVAPAAPPAAVLSPPVVSAQPRPAPPALAPIVPDAAGVAAQIPGGIRVTFGSGKVDLNAATDGALHAFAKSVAADPAKSVNLYAYAAGAPDDPSTPRRLSLSRALAVRAILINEGIASTRIYPRALGATATASDGPPDRVDVTIVGAVPPPAAPAAAPPAAPPPASAPPASPAAPSAAP